MRIIQQPCQHYSEIDKRHIQRALGGKWHQLTPRTFLVKRDAKYLAVSFHCLDRIAAAFLKIFQIDYFKHLLKAKEFKILNPRMPPNSAKATPAAQPVAYDLDRTLNQVQAEAARLQGLAKKFCLFLCRGSNQAVPQNPDEAWVSLDITHLPSIDGRIHVKMNINDQRLIKLCGLFDKVIMDVASFDLMHHSHPWRSLRELLKKTPQAELIAPVKNIDARMYQSEEHLQRCSINHQLNASRGDIQYPCVMHWDAEQRKAAKRNGIEEAYPHMTRYLQSLFQQVILLRQQPFPCQKGLKDYYILKGPKV